MIINLIGVVFGAVIAKVFQIWGFKSLKSWGVALGLILVFCLLEYSKN